MSIESRPQPDERTQTALDDLEGIIRRRYPMASFNVARGDDPEGIYLRATVDLDDVEEIVDQELLDHLFDVQVEQSLPIYVIPLQPVERVLAEMEKGSQKPNFSSDDIGSALGEERSGLAHL